MQKEYSLSYLLDGEKEIRTIKLAEEEVKLARDKAIYKKATKVKYEDALKQFTMVYLYEYNIFVYIDELKDMIQHLIESGKDKPKYIYGTYDEQITLDASSILNDACDDLHEDAYDNIMNSGGVDELQKFLHEWADKYGACTQTYYEDFNFAILIDN